MELDTLTAARYEYMRVLSSGQKNGMSSNFEAEALERIKQAQGQQELISVDPEKEWGGGDGDARN